MSELITESTEPGATAAGKAPEGPPKKPVVGAQKGRVAKSEGRPGKKAIPAKKAPKAFPKATPKAKTTRPGKATKEKGVREGSKTEAILTLLGRSGGVTLKELMKATGWQAHSVRGFLSGALNKKMGLTVASPKAENGDRTYSVKA